MGSPRTTDEERAFWKLVGNRLRIIRRDAGYSQLRASNEAEMSERFYSDLEAGNVGTSGYRYARLARVYRVSLDWLFAKPGTHGEDEYKDGPSFSEKERP